VSILAAPPARPPLNRSTRSYMFAQQGHWAAALARRLYPAGRPPAPQTDHAQALADALAEVYLPPHRTAAPDRFSQKRE
jgi:hypothetical protein